MPEKTERLNRECLQAEAWIQQYIAVYGRGAITRYSKRRLNGVSLVRVIQALELGRVIDARKIGASGIGCKVEYTEDNDNDGEVVVIVTVNASINYTTPVLVIDHVEERKENDSGTDHAA